MTRKGIISEARRAGINPLRIHNALRSSKRMSAVKVASLSFGVVFSVCTLCLAWFYLVGRPADVVPSSAQETASRVASMPVAADADAAIVPPAQTVAQVIAQAADVTGTTDVQPTAAPAPIEAPPAPPAAVQVAATEPAVPVDSAAIFCGAVTRTLAGESMVFFRMSSIDVDAQYNTALRRFGAAVAKCPDIQVDVGGHSDATGEQTSNLQLSWRRAESVIQRLAALGIATAQFAPVGYSAARPFALQPPGADQPKNRRVEFVVRQ